jgi:preprotein translocase subunit SecG
MNALITALHVFVCVFLILVILLQAGKGGGGLGFGIQGSQTVFGGRGSQTFLGKVTSACAAIFFTTCIVLSFMASHGSVAARAARVPDAGAEVVDAGALEVGSVDGSAGLAPLPSQGSKEEISSANDAGGVIIPKDKKELPKP